MKNITSWILVFFLGVLFASYTTNLNAAVPEGPWHINDPELKDFFKEENDYYLLVAEAQENGWNYVDFHGCAGGAYQCVPGTNYSNFERIINYPCNPGLIQAVWNWNCGEDPNYQSDQYRTSYGMFKGLIPEDSDGDDIADFEDNCIDVVNPGQADIDQDEIGDDCDADKPYMGGVDLGPPDNACQLEYKGDPINIFNGNMVESTTDFALMSPFDGGIKLERYYDSISISFSALGLRWDHSYLMSLTKDHNEDEDQIAIVGDGRVFYFEDIRPYYDQTSYEASIFTGKYSENSVVTIDVDNNFVWKRQNGKAYKFELIDEDGDIARLKSITDKNGNVQTLSYNQNELLDTVYDHATGKSLTFHYNPSGMLSYVAGPVTDAVPDGIWVTYNYDGFYNLVSVTYADSGNGSLASGIEYRYEDPNDINNLTSKHDLAGHFIASWQYNTEGLAYENTTLDGMGVTIDYSDPDAVEVTDAYGITSTYTITSINRRKKVATVDQESGCSTCTSGLRMTDYDPTTGDPIRREFFNGKVVEYLNYDANHNPQTVIIDPGTEDEETITKTYHPVLNTSLSITEKSLLADSVNPNRLKLTIYDYDDPANPSDTDTPNEAPTNLIHRTILQGYTNDAAGVVVAFEEITTYEYDARGQVTGVDGPWPGGDDAVILQYDPVSGDLDSIISPLVGTSTFNYDAAGNMVRTVDVNGVVTVIGYDGRNRPTTITVDGKLASIAYTAAGEVDTVTDRSGIVLDYAYNLQGFLERITGPSGAYLAYLYDSNGKVSDESIHRADDTRTRYMGYDYGNPLVTPDLAPGKPWKLITRNPEDTADLETVLAYTNGLVSRITDPEGHWKSLSFDTRGRLTHTEADQDSVRTALTQLNHDLGDNLTSVIDPEGGQTVYTLDDAGRLVKQASPDTGTTRFNYDAAGRLVTKILADGSTTSYDYDALNRLTDISYADSSRDVSFTYDVGAYGNGRLTGISDPSGTYTYSYNSLGQLLSEDKVTYGTAYTTGYTWDDAGKPLTITYPSGRIIRYERRTDGSIERVVTEIDSTTNTLADAITHLPFGPLEAFTFGNGITLTKGFDLSYQPATINHSGIMDVDYIPDDGGNVTQIMDVLALADEIFTYDGLYQLTDATGPYNPIDYTYDGVGNRETRTQDQTTQTYTYTEGTNRLEHITGDSTGAGNGIRTYEYNAEGRIKRILENDVELASYDYNSKGQRTSKSIGGTTTLYHYDLDGLLIAETASSGAVQREYVYLDSQPLAMIDYSSGAVIYYYHNDHLGTPKAITNTAGSVVWKAWHTPFGEATVTVNAVENNLRFAGQYYDDETGLHYNYHRYYDPKIGRYLRADPIGLAGGINLYAYTANNPINGVDPAGLNTLFLGGAGYESETKIYSSAIVRKMQAASIPSPEYLPIGTRGGQAGNIWLTLMNMKYANDSIPTRNVTDKVCEASNNEGGQRNLVGYSYGSTIAAQAALRIANSDSVIHNLILVGSPISNDSPLYKALTNNSNIRNIYRIDIPNDPFSGGIDVTNISNMNNHFHYISNEQGQQDRLVQQIRNMTYSQMVIP